ncbi:MAG: phosphoglycerate mutase family protein [Streptococcaceae bacterium]|jgi:probable phosphoglycerate mutase|nr:phosphoglycerate mutase family protein [Streptococcaceae bacterium]
MSKKSTLYIVRHGKTMFNTIGRAQGWSDTPLTKKGEEGIHELGAGLALEGLQFKAAFSSDSGRTMLTMDILMEELGHPHIPYMKDKRIREWCFGSLDGGYDKELFDGVLPRTNAYQSVRDFKNLTYETIANGLIEADTAGWAEPWQIIYERIWTGFEDIAHAVAKQGGGNALVVSHGMTIGTLCSFIASKSFHRNRIDNASVTIIEYDKNNGFHLVKIGDMSYRKKGREILNSASNL